MRDIVKQEFPQSEFASSNCSFGATRMNAASIAAGAVAHLSGERTPDPKGPREVFAVDISASKLSRDPEPMLSVRVRKLEP